jgi:hypothetical protein
MATWAETIERLQSGTKADKDKAKGLIEAREGTSRRHAEYLEKHQSKSAEALKRFQDEDERERALEQSIAQQIVKDAKRQEQTDKENEDIDDFLADFDSTRDESGQFVSWDRFTKKFAKTLDISQADAAAIIYRSQGDPRFRRIMAHMEDLERRFPYVDPTPADAGAAAGAARSGYSGPSQNQIFANYAKNYYGSTPESNRNGAIAALWELRDGQSSDAGAEWAEMRMDRHIRSMGGGGTSGSAGTDGPDGGATTTGAYADPTRVQGPEGWRAERDFELGESADEAGRRRAFSRFVQDRMPDLSPLAEQAVMRQRDRFGDIFDIRKGLGTLSPDLTFKDYLGYQVGGPESGYEGQVVRPDPSVLTGLQEGLRGLWSDPREVGEDWSTEQFSTASSYRDALEADLARQGSIAQTAAEQAIPRHLRDRFGTMVDRNLDQYRLAQGLGDENTESFFHFINTPRGAIGNPENYMSLAKRTADLFGSTSRTGAQTGTWSNLRLDPNRQFTIALNARLPDIPAPLREGFKREALKKFRQWEGQQFQPSDGSAAAQNFLPYMESQDFRFFGG